MNRRVRAGVTLAIVIALGLALQLIRNQPWTDPAGTILYVAAIACLGAVIIPGRPVLVTGISVGWALVVEGWQATGMPAALVSTMPPLRVVTGTTFAWWDLVWTGVAAPLAWAVLQLVSPAEPDKDAALQQ